MQLMKQAAIPLEPAKIAPVYSTEVLESSFRDAVEGFLEPCRARIGL